MKRAVLALAIALLAGALPNGVATAEVAHRATFPGVTFLPPVANGPRPTAAIDPDVDLRIEIFALASDSAVGSPIGPSYSTSGSGAQRIRLHGSTDIRSDHYHANWGTRRSKLPNGAQVRIEVRLPSAAAGPVCNSGVTLEGGCIGYFDVQLRRAKKGTAPTGMLGFQNRRTLPIRIHIADGALDAPEPPDEPGLRELLGEPDSPAAAAIPVMDFEFDEDDYAPNPDFGGMVLSFRTLFLAFKLDVTVAEANALLAEIGAEIIGGQSGAPEEATGLLLIRVPTTSHQDMQELIAQLVTDVRVELAVQDSILEPVEIPDPVPAGPVEWSWETTPAEGNWGVEAIRAPQLWNLNRHLEKEGAHEAKVGVYDTGFFDHDDIVVDNDLTTDPGTHRDHGTHVAGTIAALYDNGVGVDGVAPYVNLFRRQSTGLIGLANLIDAGQDLDVVNLSLGYNWYDRTPARNPGQVAALQNLVKGHAHAWEAWQNARTAHGKKLPLLVAAAGNDSESFSLGNADIDAKWGSAWAYAALVDGVDNIIVVEAVGVEPGGGTSRAPFSNINGHVSAPGVDILSTGPNNWYAYKSGTSMAAPHVTGIAAYLASLDPTLTPTEVRSLLMSTAVAGGDFASSRVDAFGAALAIDGLRGNSNVLNRLLDIDDGTVDGNLRMDCVGPCTEMTSEDFDGDGGIGDGSIDMSDFRRWRDWFLQATDNTDAALDGDFNHPKFDLNGDGDTGGGTTENVYPYGDLNGDGVIDLNTIRYMPGYINGSVTDLEALQTLFADPDYSATQLPGLIESADIHVDPNACMTTGVTGIQTKIFEADSGFRVDDRFDRSLPMDHEYTLPVVDGGYMVRIEAFNASGQTAGIAQASFEAPLGSDSWFAPASCGLVEIAPRELKVTLNAGETAKKTVHLASADLTADWELIGSMDHVEPSLTGGELTGDDAVEFTFTCPEETTGRFQDTYVFKIKDKNGRQIELNVPNWVNVDLKCLEGGVVLDPPTLTFEMYMGTSNSRQFLLTNKGTELLYKAEPEDMLAIDDSATGTLDTEGHQFLSVTATCPMRTGTFKRDVELSFENPDTDPPTDKEPLKVEVPEKLVVEFTCTGPLTLVEQAHETNIDFETLDDAWERLWSRDALRTGQYNLRHTVDGESAYTQETVEPLGWGNWTSELDLDRTIEEPPPGSPWYQSPHVRAGTLTGHSSLKYHSSYDGTTAKWGADFSFVYTTSRPPPNLDIGHEVCNTFSVRCSTVDASSSIWFEIAPNGLQQLEITWTCGKFITPTDPIGRTTTGGHVWLRGPLGAELFDSSRTENAAMCSYETVLGAGRYSILVTLGIQAGASESAADSGSYSVTLTYVPEEAPE